MPSTPAYISQQAWKYPAIRVIHGPAKKPVALHYTSFVAEEVGKGSPPVRAATREWGRSRLPDGSFTARSLGGREQAEEGTHAGAAGHEAMAEEEIGVPIGAPGSKADGRFRHPASTQLMADGRRQIQGPVAGARRREDTRRAGIGGREGFINARVYLIAVRPDAGAMGRQAVLRTRAERLRHRFQRADGDASRRATPAGVGQADSIPDGIEEKDGQAVDNGDAQQQAGRVRHQRVAVGNGRRRRERARRTVLRTDDSHARAVNLRRNDQTADLETKQRTGPRPVGPHGIPVVRHRKGKIKRSIGRTP